MLNVIDLQRWANMLVVMLEDLEHWFCKSTHAGEMKKPKQDKEIPLLCEMQPYSYYGAGGTGGNGKERTTHEYKRQKKKQSGA